MRTYQLRRYRVKPGEMEAWLDEWRHGVVPLRERFGFRIDGAWAVRAEDRFVWIISYDGADGFEAANERYYRSEERAALDPDPARHLAETEATLMEAVLERAVDG